MVDNYREQELIDQDVSADVRYLTLDIQADLLTSKRQAESRMTMKMVNRPGKNEATAAVLGIAGAMIIALFAVLMVRGEPDEPLIPTVSKTTVQQGSQEGAWSKVPQECKVVGQIAPECLEGLSTAEREAMRCQHEDGNEDGSPCLWLDPKTGYLYYQDSREYRN